MEQKEIRSNYEVYNQRITELGRLLWTFYKKRKNSIFRESNARTKFLGW